MCNEKKIILKEAVFNEFKEFYKEYAGGRIQVLDVGAGDDWYINKFKELGIQALGLDIVYGEGIALKGCMEDIPLHSDKFVDILFAAHSFEHTIDPIKTIKEFHRVLKPNGLIFIVTPYPNKQQIHGMNSTHYFCLTLDQQTALFEHFGFRIISTNLLNTEENEIDWQQILVGLKV